MPTRTGGSKERISVIYRKQFQFTLNTVVPTAYEFVQLAEVDIPTNYDEKFIIPAVYFKSTTQIRTELYQRAPGTVAYLASNGLIYTIKIIYKRVGNNIKVGYYSDGQSVLLNRTPVAPFPVVNVDFRVMYI